MTSMVEPCTTASNSSTNPPLTNEIVPSLQNDNTMKRKQRLLIWPFRDLPPRKNDKGDSDSDNTKSIQQGLVIGWKTLAPRSPHRQRNPQNAATIETFCVAGILPLPLPLSMANTSVVRHHPTPNTVLIEAVQQVQDRIKRLSQNTCNCCNCDCTNSVKSDPDNLCSGCVQTICFQDLSVLALYFSSEKAALQRERTTPLRDLFVIVPSRKGHPWFWNNIQSKGDDDQGGVLDTGQLLVYDTAPCSDAKEAVATNCYSTIFRHSSAATDSIFSSKLLPRLTHSHKVKRMILTNDDDVTAWTWTKATESDSNMSADDSTNDEHKHMLFYLPLNHFIFRHSLFYRHLYISNNAHSATKKSPKSLPIIHLIETARRHWFQSRSNLAIRTRCKHCAKTTSTWKLSQFEERKHYIQETDDLVRSIVEAATGVCTGLALVWLLSLNEPGVLMLQSVTRRHYLALRQGMSWLETFPVGVKVNERLAANYGLAVGSFLDLHEQLLHIVTSVTGMRSCILPSTFLLGVGSFFGGSSLFFLLFDFIRLLTFHLSVLSMVFNQFYSLELYLLSALWRLMRGKKKNILRLRTDTMEYDSTQLLLGTILFSVALFLFTTIWVYHVFFAASELLATLTSLPLILVGILILDCPWGKIITRIRRPAWFIDTVYVEETASQQSSAAEPFDVTELHVVERSLLTVASETMLEPIQAVLCWPITASLLILKGVRPQTSLIEVIGKDAL